MKTIGEILKAERERQLKSLKEISKKTKIPLKTLTALEVNDFASLPPQAFTQGFIKNYAQELGLEPKRLLAIFRRDLIPKQNSGQLKFGLETESGLRWRPKMTLILAVVLFLMAFGGYLFFQLRHYWGQPELEIIAPHENETVQEKIIKVEGKTDPEVTLKINDQVVSLNEQGNFQKEIEVFEGENMILIEAISRIGKKTEIERKIHYVL